jgi:hypothetical protein
VLILTAQGIGLVVNLLRYLQNLGAQDAGRQLALNTIFTSVAALLIVVAAIWAAQTSQRGAPPFRTYALALGAISFLCAIVESFSRQVLFAPAAGAVPDLNEWVACAYDFVDVVAVGGIGMLAYHNRRRVTQIVEGIRAAELRHIQLRRQLIESRLAASHAQVDPNALFASLAYIRDLYARSDPGADRELDRLIEELRDRRIAAGAAQAIRAP